MTCPRDGTWFNSKDSKEIGPGSTHTFEYDNKKKGRYHCTYDQENKRYDFYVQGKGE